MFLVVHTEYGEELVGLVGEDVIKNWVIDFIIGEVGEATQDESRGVLGVGLCVAEG